MVVVAGLAVRLAADPSVLQRTFEPSTQPADPIRMLLAARDDRLHGRYGEARAKAELVALEHPPLSVRAAIELAALDRDTGRLLDGLARLKSQAAKGEASADWQTAMAMLLMECGEYETTITHARRAIELEKSAYPARWFLGQALERTGRIGDAAEAYKAFDEVMTTGTLPDDAEQATYIGQGFLRYSELTHTNVVQRTRHVLDEVFGSAVDLIDASYWPARLAAADLLRSRHNLSGARAEYERILKDNPYAADAMAGLARTHLEDWNFDECETLGTQALAFNEKHVGSLVLMASLRMAERKYAPAAEFARQALVVNPRSEEALGTLAAAEFRQGNVEAAAEIESRARKSNPKPAMFHFLMGEWLSAGRQFELAETHFKKSIRYSRNWPEPRTSLGQLYMELGDEVAARRELEAAFELDSFNQHTYNVLGLLDRIDHFATLESEHFIIRYDASTDAVLAPYFSRALEAIHEEVCDNFATRLTHKTIIEIFPDHGGFSVRITGRPFIGTIGACTGRVIAMTAPRGRPPFGRFNWASVLRHEFTHTVTLAATENRIPHWFTEGLAVYEEPSPRSWSSKELLVDAIRRDELFTLETIDWGFARPKRPTDRSLAYAQSEWMSEYIIHRFRYQAILDLLGAFREGQTQDAAFESVLKISPKEFDRDFRNWAREEAAKWGFSLRPPDDLKQLEARLRENPEDSSLLATVARARLDEGDTDGAYDAAEEALNIDEKQADAHEVMSRIYVGKSLAAVTDAEREHWLESAAEHVEPLMQLRPDNLTAIKYMGYIKQASGAWDDALALYEQYLRRAADDPDVLRRMAAIHLRRRDYPKAIQQLEALFHVAEDEPPVARQIARLYAANKQWDQSAHWYLQAIHIDPYDVDTQLRMGAALMAAGHSARAADAFEAACRLDPNHAEAFDQLAEALEKAGEADRAKDARTKAEALRK